MIEELAKLWNHVSNSRVDSSSIRMDYNGDSSWIGKEALEPSSRFVESIVVGDIQVPVERSVGSSPYGIVHVVACAVLGAEFGAGEASTVCGRRNLRNKSNL